MKELKFNSAAYEAGKSECTTCTYGIRSLGFRDYFERHYGKMKSIYVSFDKPEYNCIVKLTGGFWRSCPELKDKRIKAYLESLGLLTWGIGCPPKFDVFPHGKNFKIVFRE